MHFLNPLKTSRMWYKVKYSRFEFSFSFLTNCLIKAKEINLPYYLHIAFEWGRGDEFMPFQRALTHNETQTATSKIWTSVTDLISFDYNP